MKINPYMTSQYHKTSPPSGAASVTMAPESHVRGEQISAKVDRFVISRDGSNQSIVSSLSKKMTDSIVSRDNPARIAQLHEAVRDGSYYVSTEDLAEVMMGHLMM